MRARRARGEVEAILLRPSYLVRNLGVVVGLCGLVLALTHSGDKRLALIVGFGTFASTLVVIGASGTRRRIPALVSPRGVQLGEKTVAARKTIRGAWVEDTPDAPIVHLSRKWRPDVHLEATDEASARALCEEIFGGSSFGMPRFAARSRWTLLMWVLFPQLMANHLLRRDWHDLGLLMSALCVLTAVMSSLRERGAISIGADGLLVYGRQFVAFRDIESVVAANRRSPSERKLVITSRHHRTMVLWMKDTEAAAAAERIQAAIAAIDAAAEPVRQQLRRGGPDVHAWLARLRTLTRREPYRAVGADVDTLWRVMDDPGAGESERAAAAVVLGAEACGEARSRLRDVAARVASPRVRVAIEMVAEEAGEDDLAAALSAVEDSRA
jgi:hypothetical protein